METFISFLTWAFRLVEGRIPESVCRVMCTANIAGVIFSAACLEGPYTLRAFVAFIVFALFACFFGSMMMLYHEAEVAYEEDPDSL